MNLHNIFKIFSRKRYSFKRPHNVDLRCSLRVIGFGNPSVEFSSDEGDGYSIYYNGTNDGLPELKSYHYTEWVSQLNILIDVLKKNESELLRIENSKNK